MGYRLRSGFLVALCLLAAGGAAAAPVSVDLPGLVVSSAWGDRMPGDPLVLDLDFADDPFRLVPGLPGGGPSLFTAGEIHVGLALWGPDYRYDDGVWFALQLDFIARDSGEVVDGFPFPGDTNIFLRFILEIEAFELRRDGRDPNSVWARVELHYPDYTESKLLSDADAFRAALRGGQVERRWAGQTSLVGTLVPEPATAPLLGLGLAALAGSRRRRGRR